MNLKSTIGALFAVAASTQICAAADPRYPDWPCAQAKVPEISLAQVWAGPPLDDAANKWKDDPKISALVAKLAVRKTPLEDAQKAVTDFLSAPGTDKATAGKMIFAGLFDTHECAALLGHERARARHAQAA